MQYSQVLTISHDLGFPQSRKSDNSDNADLRGTFWALTDSVATPVAIRLQKNDLIQISGSTNDPGKSPRMCRFRGGSMGTYTMVYD